MLASLGRVISTSALFFCLQSTMLARICENMRRISALARFDRAILRSQREEVGRISPLRRRGENRPLGCMRHPNFGSWPHLVSLDPYLPAAGTVGKGTGVRHRSGRSLGFFFCGIFLGVYIHSELGGHPLCRILCRSWKLSDPKSFVSSPPSAICAQVRSALSLAAAESRPATAPSPTTRDTIHKFDSHVKWTEKPSPNRFLLPPPGGRHSPKSMSTIASRN